MIITFVAIFWGLAKILIIWLDNNKMLENLSPHIQINIQRASTISYDHGVYGVRNRLHSITNKHVIYKRLKNELKHIHLGTFKIQIFFQHCGVDRVRRSSKSLHFALLQPNDTLISSLTSYIRMTDCIFRFRIKYVLRFSISLQFFHVQCRMLNNRQFCICFVCAFVNQNCRISSDPFWHAI